MSITFDEDFPPEIAQLVDAFSRCSDGVRTEYVIEAAGNMLAYSLHVFATQNGMSTDQLARFANNALQVVFDGTMENFKKRSKPQSISVRLQ